MNAKDFLTKLSVLQKLGFPLEELEVICYSPNGSKISIHDFHANEKELTFLDN